MDPYLPLISCSPLFQGMQPDQIEAMAPCLDARERSFPKGSAIFRIGDTTSALGMVLEGSVRIEQEDYWGNRSILAAFGPGQTFGEVYACDPRMTFDVNAIAAEDAVVLFLDVERITAPCSTACAFHPQLIRNLLGIVARRTHVLTRKIEHTAKRTTRAKLLSYLSDQARLAGSSAFSIPFNRQELADYLAVDRSALSAEMSRMHEEGLIDYRKNRFFIERIGEA